MLMRASFLFGRPVICLPWYMEMPAQNEGDSEQGFFDILRPAHDLKPPADFPRLMKEYRTWMKENPDRDRSAFLAAAHDMHSGEELLWNIQQILRKAGRDREIENRNSLTLKWHILLHLARAMEKEQDEAEDALRDLRKHESPLKDALEEDTEAPGLMEDLPDALAHTIVASDLLRDICESWLGLFGSCIQEGWLLVTFDETIRNYVNELFEEDASRVHLIRPVSTIRFHVPDPLTFPSEQSQPSDMRDFREGMLPVITMLRKILSNKSSENSHDVEALIRRIERRFPVSGASRRIAVEILFLPAVSGSHAFRMQAILNGLAGKALAFMREDSNNE